MQVMSQALMAAIAAGKIGFAPRSHMLARDAARGLDREAVDRQRRAMRAAELQRVEKRRAKRKAQRRARAITRRYS